VVVSINISRGGIPKLQVDSAYAASFGLKGDGHNHEKHKSPLQAVCLQDLEFIEELRYEGFPLTCGTIGENLTVHNLHVQKLPAGTILEFCGGVVLELTKPRKPCYVLDSIDPRLKSAIAGRCGFYARVLKEGWLIAGETIRVIA
jgi:MOSC domain-containing protein YiiM